MKAFQVLFAMAVLATLTLSGCKKDDPEPDDENEVITTVSLVFSLAPEPDLVYTWKQIGASPVIDTIKLSASKAYTLSTKFLNEAATPAEDITVEVAEEDEDHQVFYFSNPGTLIETTYQDVDANSLPVGLNMRALTGTAGSGTFRVVLKHAPGAKDGNLATGSTDVDVTFPVVILP